MYNYIHIQFGDNDFSVSLEKTLPLLYNLLVDTGRLDQINQGENLEENLTFVKEVFRQLMTVQTMLQTLTGNWCPLTLEEVTHVWEYMDTDMISFEKDFSFYDPTNGNRARAYIVLQTGESEVF